MHISSLRTSGATDKRFVWKAFRATGEQQCHFDAAVIQNIVCCGSWFNVGTETTKELEECHPGGLDAVRESVIQEKQDACLSW